MQALTDCAVIDLRAGGVSTDCGVLHAGEANSINNHNQDDTVAGVSQGKVRTHHLVDGKLAALVTTEPDRGRGTVQQKGDKCDSHRRPTPTDDSTQLYDADGSADRREPGLKGSADEDVSATAADHCQANHEKSGQEAFHSSPPNEDCGKCTPIRRNTGNSQAGSA